MSCAAPPATPAQAARFHTALQRLCPPHRLAPSVIQRRGIVFTMRTTIDKAGRLVIPRALRNRVGLASGGEVEIEIDGAALRIEPVTGSALSENSGLLVIPASGMRIDDALVRELIDDDRHRR